MSQFIDELLQKARTASASNDKVTLDKVLYQILSADIECDEAWSLLYKGYGKGKSREEFETYIIQKYFSEQNISQKESDTPVTLPIKPQSKTEPNKVITKQQEQSIVINVGNQNQREHKKSSKSRGTFGSVIAGITYMPYAGFYAIQAIITAEILLAVTIAAIVEAGIVGPIAVLFLLGIVSYLVPTLGMLIYSALMFLLFASGVIGGIIGLGFGIACGIVYFLTRWASSIVATIACAILGGIVGYVAGYWANNLFGFSDIIGEWWNVLSFIVFILTGVVGGVLFVSVADDTSIGSHAQEKAMENSQNEKSFSPIKIYTKVADYVNWSITKGE